MGSGGGLCAVVVDRGGGGLYFLVFLWVEYVILLCSLYYFIMLKVRNRKSKIDKIVFYEIKLLNL